MSLVVSVLHIYRAAQEGTDGEDTPSVTQTSECESFENECLIKVEFRKTVQKIFFTKNQIRHELKRMVLFGHAPSDDLRDNSCSFGLGTDLSREDSILVEFFRTDVNFFKRKKPFAKFEMLLESLLDKERFSRVVTTIIDDHLIDSKTNRLTEFKVKFELVYSKPSFESKRPFSDRKSIFFRRSSKQENYDQTVPDPDEYDYDNSDVNEFFRGEFDGELEAPKLDHSIMNILNTKRFLQNAIGRATLSLAQTAYNPNMIIPDTEAKNNENAATKSQARTETGMEPENPLAAMQNQYTQRKNNSNSSTNPRNLVKQILSSKLNNKITSWQIRVRVIELKYILGKLNDSIYFCVDIANEQFRSTVKTLDNLYFDEVFNARIDGVKSQIVLNYLIKISVYQKNFLMPDSLLGSFQIDFGTVYKHSNHQVHHKWGPLSKDEANMDGDSYVNPKGYVKCDFSVLSKGDKVETHQEDSDHDDDIDNNLVTPYGLEQARIPIDINFLVYSADILVKNETSRLATLKNRLMANFSLTSKSSESEDTETQVDEKTAVVINLLSETEDPDLAHLNTFVQVTYNGITKRTKSLKATNKPNWNEKIMFKCLFPPLIRLFKIELCNEVSFGSPTVLATEYLNIDEISDYTDNDYFLPTLGPCNIDFYTEPQNFRVNKNKTLTQQSDPSVQKPTRPDFYLPIFGDVHPGGGEYVSRVFMGVKSFRRNMPTRRPEKELKTLAEVRTKVISNMESFIVNCIISDVTLVGPNLSNSQLNFRLCFGPYGYDTIYDQFALQPMNMTKPMQPIQLGPKMPFYLPYDKSKPCMTLNFMIEDLRNLMFKANFIKYSVQTMLLSTRDTSFETLTTAQLREYYRESSNIKTYLKIDYLRAMKTCPVSLSDLERNRVKQLTEELDVLLGLIKSYSRFDADFKKMKFTQMKDSIEKINSYINEPLSLIPDVTLWLIADNKPIGVCTIKASDIIWSPKERKKGAICNQLIYTDIKSLNPADREHPIRENVARVRLNLWFGLSRDQENIYNNLNNNDGHTMSERCMNKLNLPMQIFYTDRLVTFELRAYIYQGRDMLGLDTTGLSDPYIQLTIGNQSVYSKTIMQTNNPIWSVTLRIPHVYCYGRFESIKLNPPEIVLCVLDEDMIGENELMGKCYLKPIIKPKHDKSEPPKLKWRKIYHKNEPAGDILASFELIMKSREEKTTGFRFNRLNAKPPDSPTSSSSMIASESIPSCIMPKMCEYSLEILYWGLRNVKQLNSVLFSQDKLMIRIEIGTIVYKSTTIDKQFSHDNFQQIHQKHKIRLPEEDEYKPHLNIRCLSVDSIGRQMLIGSYTIKSISDYYKDKSQLKALYKNYSAQNYRYGVSVSTHVEQGDLTPDLLSDQMRRKRALEERLKKKKALKPQNKPGPRPIPANKDNLLMDTEYLDWWSKYYGSIKQHDPLNKHKAQANEKSSSSSSSSSSCSESSSDSIELKESSRIKKLKVRKKADLKPKDDTDDDVFLENNDKKKRPRRNSKTKKNKKPTTKKSAENERYTVCKSNSKLYKNVQKIQVLECELEKVEQFKGINKVIETYPLLKGKNQQAAISNEMIQCHFKGNFLLYKEDDELASDFSILMKQYGGFLKTIPLNTTTCMVKIRIYVVKALIMNKSNNSCQPYLFLQYGDKQIDYKDNVKYNTLEPVFGSSFEFDVRFPYESQLTIGLKDWNLLRTSNKNLIGKTTIDLEDRFFSKQYACCGLPKKYELTGYNAWRDTLTPFQILMRLCRQWRLERPEFVISKENSFVKIVTINNQPKEYRLSKKKVKSMHAIQLHPTTSQTAVPAISAPLTAPTASAPSPVSPPSVSPVKSVRQKDTRFIKEQLALEVLNDWENITGLPLVPEHVETRSLFNLDRQEVEQGKLQMWVDIFSLEDSSSASSYNQHRQQIKPMVSIAPRKPKKFQLRIIIYNTVDVILDDVNLLSGEKSSDIYIKGFFSERSEEAQKTDTHFRSLNGEGNFNWRFIFDFDYLPAEERIVYNKREHPLSLYMTEHKIEPIVSLQCWDADVISADDQLGSIQLNLCCMLRGAKTSKACKLDMINNKNWPKINLFKLRNHRGWWPMFAVENNRMKLTGKVEAEFILLNEQQATDKPAGLGRSEPDPLPEPNRPDSSFLWFMAPMRTFRYVIWKNNKCLIIKIILLVLLIIFVIILIYTLPSTLIEKALSKIG